MRKDTEVSEGNWVAGSGVVDVSIKAKDGEQEEVHYARLI